MIEHVEQRERVMERKRRDPGRERALVEQRDPLTLRELEVAEDALGEIGERSEIADPDRAERPHFRQAVLRSALARRARQARDEHVVLPAARPFARRRVAARTDVPRGGRALSDQMLAHEQPIVVGGLDAEQLPHADPRRDAVHGCLPRDRALRNGTGFGHALDRGHGELDVLAFSCDANEILEREVEPGEHDGHGGTIISEPPRLAG